MKTRFSNHQVIRWGAGLRVLALILHFSLYTFNCAAQEPRLKPTPYTQGLVNNNADAASTRAYMGVTGSSGGSSTNGTYVGGNYSMTTNSGVLNTDGAMGGIWFKGGADGRNTNYALVCITNVAGVIRVGLGTTTPAVDEGLVGTDYVTFQSAGGVFFVNNVTSGTARNGLLFNSTGPKYVAFYSDGVAARSSVSIGAANDTGIVPTTPTMQWDVGNNFVGAGIAAPNSRLHVQGSFATAFTNLTSGLTLTAAESVVSVDTTGGSITVTLPTAVGIKGRIYRIKKTVAANTLNIATTSSQTIDGGASPLAVTTLNAVTTLISNDANWLIY